MELNNSHKMYGGLAAVLFLATFGFGGVFIMITSIVCFAFGFLYVMYWQGRSKADEMSADFEYILKHHKFPPGIAAFLKNRHRFSDKSSYDQIHSMTQSPAIDEALEQILSYILRDYVDTWYRQMTSDELFRESLKRTSRRSISALSQCMRRVDWVPFLTRHVVDDFASHLRLFRMASERSVFHKDETGDKSPHSDLISHFFDLELEMEKHLCRDLLSTTPHYENAYLHDLVDIVLYLIMPPEDFRCRPLRFLLREVIVRRLIVPLLDHFSDPNNMNQLLVWLIVKYKTNFRSCELSEVTPRPDDFISALENSRCAEELDAVWRALREEVARLRGRDAGGEQGEFVKQQLSSLEYVESVIKKKLACLAETTEMGREASLADPEDGLVQLPIHVVLTNSVAVSYFIDYLATVGGSNYIDCYLAIEGFKVSVEHQLRSMANGETAGVDVYETVKEAARFMYQQYLSQEAITRVPLDDAVIARFLARLKNDEPSDEWFEQIQDKIVHVLRSDDRFYPEFKRDPLYAKMLCELGIVDEDRCDSPSSCGSSMRSDASSAMSAQPGGGGAGGGSKRNSVDRCPSLDDSDEPLTSAVVETLGIGQQGKQSFALYNVRVQRTCGGKKVSNWNVLRRYSDFHTLHTLIQQSFPRLSNLSFPGKKTFNNLDAHFLEKRTKALNSYLECVLQPSIQRAHPGLDKILFDFLSQKDYVASREPIAKKMMSAIWDPIRQGAGAIGKAVTAVPDQVFDGVTKVGDGIGKAAKAVIGQPSVGTGPRASFTEPDRVAAAIANEPSNVENIPLRVMLMLVDEVFGMRSRNAWFRRQLVTLLRQIVTPLGTSINKRIVDVVHWLTSDQQVHSYIAAVRESIWPDGQLAPEAAPRSEYFHLRTGILARSLMLSALPDELRMVMGAETTYRGVQTVCDALQIAQLNRRLLYVLLERLLITIFPNNRFERIFAQLHSKSPRSRRN